MLGLGHASNEERSKVMTEETKRGRKPDPRTQNLYPWHKVRIPGYAQGKYPPRADVVRAREEGDTGPEALIRQGWAEECWVWPRKDGEWTAKAQWPTARQHGRSTTVYKLVYEYYFNGGEALPEGAAVYGTCDNKAYCVNPLHRVLQIDRENVCRNGHPRTEENTYYTSQGVRSCVQCRVEHRSALNTQRKRRVAEKYRTYFEQERKERHHRFNNALVAMTDKEYIAHLEEVAGEWERQRWQIESLKAKLGED